MDSECRYGIRIVKRDRFNARLVPIEKPFSSMELKRMIERVYITRHVAFTPVLVNI